jgi:UDP-4-amino-4,6-dideoxy-N-acetyl-beta-L-altrosamine transaminase
MHTIPYGRQDITQADIDAVVDVMKSDFLTQGPCVPRFENRLCELTGVTYSLAMNSATSALHIACLALGVGPGDRVWTSPNTFVASANCALYCGASVDFVDIDMRTYNMCVDSLEEKLVKAELDGCLPKVVIPVHFAGQSCDMARISVLSATYGFRVIEDASHAIGGMYGNYPVGSCMYSDVTVFSFHPVKIVTTGEGGAALTNSAEVAACMSRLRTHGITTDKSNFASRPPDEIWNYQQCDLGFNYRMTELQAALGSAQIDRLHEFIGRRWQLAESYRSELSPLNITLPYQSAIQRSSLHLFPILVSNSSHPLAQKSLMTKLHANGVLSNLHYIPVYLQPYYANLGFVRGYCPNAERYYKRTISLPMFPGLTHEDQLRVCSIIRDWCIQ